MSEDRMIDGIKVVDYAGFVDLTAEHEKTQSWL
jgi:tRNA 2-thiouridine synthesizing protein B